MPLDDDGERMGVVNCSIFQEELKPPAVHPAHGGGTRRPYRPRRVDPLAHDVLLIVAASAFGA